MKTIQDKPKGLEPEYGAQFDDISIVRAYPRRPPYPPELFDLFQRLIRDAPSVVLDLGCGTGDISRPLAPLVDRVDAVDPSRAMISRGQTLPGGQHPHIHWTVSSAEDFSYPQGYALVIAAESLHWMDWYTVLPQIHQSLTGQGRMAIVLGRGFRDEPWAASLGRLIAQYSTNREYQPYDLVEELTRRNLFVVEQRLQTQPIPFSQPLEAYIESFHSRNGLSRDRMGASATAFDEQLRDIIVRYQPNPVLEFELVAEVVWGRPAGSSPMMTGAVEP
jgi:SAM-dependent methyltransferase